MACLGRPSRTRKEKARGIRDALKGAMDVDEQAIAAGLRRLRINKQLSAVKVAVGPLGFGKDLGSTLLRLCSRACTQLDGIFESF